MDHIFHFLVAALVFAGIDLVWLGVIAKKFYRQQMGKLFASKIVAAPAILFYAMYIFGVLFFALNPALEESSIQTALINGGLFGLIAYATYDLTNWATTENWPPKLAVVDMLWGAILTATTTTVVFLIFN